MNIANLIYYNINGMNSQEKAPPLQRDFVVGMIVQDIYGDAVIADAVVELGRYINVVLLADELGCGMWFGRNVFDYDAFLGILDESGVVADTFNRALTITAVNRKRIRIEKHVEDFALFGFVVLLNNKGGFIHYAIKENLVKRNRNILHNASVLDNLAAANTRINQDEIVNRNNELVAFPVALIDYDLFCGDEPGQILEKIH